MICTQSHDRALGHEAIRPMGSSMWASPGAVSSMIRLHASQLKRGAEFPSWCFVDGRMASGPRCAARGDRRS